MARRGPRPGMRLKLEQLLAQNQDLSAPQLAKLLGTSSDSVRSLRSRIRRNGFRNNLCPECGRGTFLQWNEERFCTSCGFVAEGQAILEPSVTSMEAVDPHSFDNGLGSEPFRTIRDVKEGTSLLNNTWQVVLGYYRMGIGDSFTEGCLRALDMALDGANYEQFQQCRCFMLTEIRRMRLFEELWKSRRKAKQFVVRRTLQAALRTWPRLGTFPRVRAMLEVAD